MSFIKHIDLRWIIAAGLLWLVSILVLILNQSSYQLEKNVTLIDQELSQATTKLNIMLSDNELINNKLEDNSYLFNEFENLANENFVLLVFKGEDLVFWNDNSVELSKNAVKKWKDGSYHRLNNGYYYYIATFPDNINQDYRNYSIAVLYLIKHDYNNPQKNKYFVNSSNSQLNIPDNLRFSDEVPYGDIDYIKVNKTGETPIYAFFDEEYSSSKNYWVVFVLQLIAMICILVAAFGFSLNMFTDKRLLGFGFLAAFCLFLFIMIMGLDFPIIFSKIPIFSRAINPDLLWISLGELLLLISFVLILMGYWNRYIKFNVFTKSEEDKDLFLYGITTFGFSVFISFIVLVAGMIVKSEETSLFLIDIINTNLFSFFGFIGMLMIIGIVFFASRWMLYYYKDTNFDNFKRTIAFVAGIAPLALLQLTNFGSLELNFALLITAIVCLALPILKFPIVKEWRLQHILVILVFSSLMVTLFITLINNRAERKNRIDYALSLVKEDVKVTPLQMKGILESINNDNVYSRYFDSPFLSFKELESRVLIKYFTDESFDILRPNIQFFDGNKNGMLNNSFINSYNDLATLLDDAEPTDVEKLWQINTSSGELNFLTVIDIPYGMNTGSLVIQFLPENMKESSEVPPLDYGDEFQDEQPNAAYDYAIYAGNNLAESEGTYPYSSNKDIFYSAVSKDSLSFGSFDNYSHLFYKPSNDRTIVVSKPNFDVLEFVSIFSFLFFALVCTVVLSVIISSILQTDNNISYAYNLFYSSMRKRISTTFFVIILFSFFLVGIVTTLYFSSRFNTETIEKLGNKRTELIKTLAYEYKDKSAKDLEKLKNNPSLTSYLKELSEIHDVNINVYDLKGRLVSSSIGHIFKDGLSSTQMNAHAYQTFDKKKQQFFVIDETIGELDYKAAYGTLPNSFGNPIGFVHLPYYESFRAQNANISNFLSTIFNAYVFILLLSSFLALYLTRSLTKPLQIIGQKINQIRLGSRNEELVWDGEDEIGELVTRYNEAVRKLESSAKSMAESERQNAYEQMAKQVSHEIKNPLTPMKLSIQQLQRVNDNNDPQLKQLVKRMCNTLIEQIDHLERVATEFSFFSRTKQEKRELLDLLTVLNSVIFLYKETKAVKIVKIFPDVNCLVLADRTQLTKVFHNILKNAMQAVRHREQGIIFVNVKVENPTSVLVSFTDNGVGIPEEGVEQVFQPNFTTKTAGMGLGLAICRTIIEDINGEIWLESKLDEGTTFFIKIPLSR